MTASCVLPRTGRIFLLVAIVPLATLLWVGCGMCDPKRSFTRFATSSETPTKEETDPEAPPPPAGDDPAGTPSTPDGNPETRQRPDIPGQLNQIQGRRVPGNPSQGQTPGYEPPSP